MHKVILYIINLVEDRLPSSWQELEVLEDGIKCFGDNWGKTLSTLHCFTHINPEIALGDERVCQYVSSSVDVCRVLADLFRHQGFLLLFNLATRKCNGCEIVTSGTEVILSPVIDPSSIRGEQVGVTVFWYLVRRSTLGNQDKKRRNKFLS